MAEFPYMPVAAGNLLADTSHMSTEQFGAYVRLLLTMWMHGGRIPDDPRELARIAGVSLRHWNNIAGVVMRPMTVGGGMVSQKRLTSTLQDINTLREKRALAGRLRWKHKRNSMHMHKL